MVTKRKGNKKKKNTGLLLLLAGAGALALLAGKSEAGGNGTTWPLGALGQASGELIPRGVPCQPEDPGTQWATANVPEIQDLTGRWIYDPLRAPVISQVGGLIQVHWLVKNIGQKDAKIEVTWCNTLFGSFTACGYNGSQMVAQGETVWVTHVRSTTIQDMAHTSHVHIRATECDGTQPGGIFNAAPNWNPPGLLHIRQPQLAEDTATQANGDGYPTGMKLPYLDPMRIR